MRKIFIALLLAVAGVCATGATEAADSKSIGTTRNQHNPEIKKGGFISGHVIEKKSEENIPFANIFIVETKQGTTSNEAGHFEFKDMRPGKYTLRVSAMGYQTLSKEVTVSKEYATVVHFELVDEALKI